MGTTDQPPLQQLASKAVIIRAGCLLCVRKIDAFGGQWEIPGGRLDEGETFRDALARELAEELGVDNAWIGGLLDALPADPLPPFPPMHYLLVEVAAPGLQPRLSDEHDRYGWFSGEQITRMAAAGAFNPSLARALVPLLAR